MSQQSDVASAIRAVNAEFTACFNRGDLAAVAALYTNDAQLLVPNHEPFSGPAAIQAVLTGLRGDGASLALESLEVEGSGDAVAEVGRYTLTLADGEPADRGKFIVLWRRVGGAWRLHRDMISSDLPAG